MSMYRRLTAPCRCCQNGKADRGNTPGICPGCELHQGSTGMKLQKQNAEHIMMWRERCREEREALRAALEHSKVTIEQKAQRIAEMTQQLSDAEHAIRTQRPTGAVIGWLEGKDLQDAEQRAESAYRSRDRMAAGLLQLDDLHHAEDHAAACSCGKAVRACRELAIAQPHAEFLNYWERKQIDRRERGLEHSLHADYPHASGRSTSGRWATGA